MAIIAFDSCQVKHSPTFGMPIVPRRRKARKAVQKPVETVQNTISVRQSMERQVFDAERGMWRWEPTQIMPPAPHTVPSRAIPTEAVRTVSDEPTQVDRRFWAANAPANQSDFAVEGEFRRYTRRPAAVAVATQPRKPVHRPYDAARECEELIDAIRPGGVPHDSPEWDEFFAKSERIERSFGFRR